MKLTNKAIVNYAKEQIWHQSHGDDIKLTTELHQKAMNCILKTYLAQNGNAEDTIEAQYPYNVVETIYQGNIDINSWTQDHLDGFEMAMNTLDEREQKIIKYRFKYRLTLRETATIIGVTQERVRQIEAKALRKLRHPSCAKYFLKGKVACESEYYEHIKQEKEKEYKEACSFVLSEIQSDRDKLVRALRKLDAELGNDICYDVPEKTPESIAMKTNIEDLDLSIRTLHCIKRYNIQTLLDLSNQTERDLRRIRNLGTKCLEEIKAKLAEYELCLKEDN